MTNIFSIKNETMIEIIPDQEVWNNLDSYLALSEIFEAQGETHEELDIQLVDKIDNFLFPKIGNYENNEEWYHSLLCNMDGVRALSLNIGHLSNEIIIGLQSLLEGDVIDFCVLCNIHHDFSSDKENRLGTILILSNKVIFSQEIVDRLSNANT